MALLGLAAFDGGLLGWLLFASHGARGPWQRGIAYIMVGIDLIGVIIITTVDMEQISASNGIIHMNPDVAMYGMVGAVSVIIANVVAGVASHIAAPEHQQKFAMENVHDEIESLGMTHIREAAKEIAPQIARAHARQYVLSTLQTSVQALPEKVEMTPSYESSRIHIVDPHGVKSKVDEEYRKGRDVDPFSDLDDEDKIVELNPETWTVEQWKACSREMNAWDFSELWARYHEGEEHPWLYQLKKKTRKKKAKQADSETV